MWLLSKKLDTTDRDEHQEWYRKIFHIQDDYLVGMCLNVSYDEWHNDPSCRNGVEGYIVYIDSDNDIDYQDIRSDVGQETMDKYHHCISKILVAEAQPHGNLCFDEVRAFKRMLGAALLEVMNYQFDAIDSMIREALEYLNQRNKERSRQLFVQTAFVPALLAAVAGVVLYLTGVRVFWWYGIIFSVLGAFVSIWMKYGKENMTGLASKQLHYLESLSRVFVGTIFGVIGMYALRCGIIFPTLTAEHEIFVYSVVAFVAAFSEQFVPSLIERLDKNDK